MKAVKVEKDYSFRDILASWTIEVISDIVCSQTSSITKHMISVHSYRDKTYGEVKCLEKPSFWKNLLRLRQSSITSLGSKFENVISFIFDICLEMRIKPI